MSVGRLIETPRFPPKSTTWKSSNSFLALQRVTLDLKGPGLAGVGLSVESRIPASGFGVLAALAGSGVDPRSISRQQKTLIRSPFARGGARLRIVPRGRKRTIVLANEAGRLPGRPAGRG